MIKLKDREGNVILELDEERFPISMPIKTVWGEREYQVNLYYLKDKKGIVTDSIKSLNINIKKEQ